MSYGNNKEKEDKRFKINLNKSISSLKKDFETVKQQNKKLQQTLLELVNNNRGNNFSSRESYGKKSNYFYIKKIITHFIIKEV